MLHKLHLFFALSLFLATAATAQTTAKFGHVNFGNLLEGLLETKQASISLESYAAAYVAKGDSLGKSLELAAAVFQEQYQSGALTPVVAQERYATLEKQQKELELFEQQSQEAIAKKRQELLEPIVNKVKNAIRDVAKEGGYTMVFDTSTGATLYALETEDLAPLVLKKL